MSDTITDKPSDVIRIAAKILRLRDHDTDSAWGEFQFRELSEQAVALKACADVWRRQTDAAQHLYAVTANSPDEPTQAARKRFADVAGREV